MHGEPGNIYGTVQQPTGEAFISSIWDFGVLLYGYGLFLFAKFWDPMSVYTFLRRKVVSLFLEKPSMAEAMQYTRVVNSHNSYTFLFSLITRILPLVSCACLSLFFLMFTRNNCCPSTVRSLSVMSVEYVSTSLMRPSQIWKEAGWIIPLVRPLPLPCLFSTSYPLVGPPLTSSSEKKKERKKAVPYTLFDLYGPEVRWDPS